MQQADNTAGSPGSPAARTVSNIDQVREIRARVQGAYWVNFHVGTFASVSTILAMLRRGRREARLY